MNIAIFTNNYLPNPFGVSGSIESFRKQFEKSGHVVYIFAPRAKGYVDTNPNVFRYPSLDINYKISFPLAIPYSSKINKIIESLKLDIIHSQHPNLLGTAAKRWAARKNIPLIFTWHTLYDQYAHFVPIIPQRWAAWWAIRNAVHYANNCDYVITPTRSVKNIIQQWGVKNPRITSISTGVEEVFYQNADREKVRKKYGLKENDILLLLVSRLTAEKNIEFLFKAVTKILKSNNQAKFLVVGEGYLLPQLKQAAQENNLERQIFFEGILTKEELKNYYAAGDIFVYASKSETQGMIITEAMYSGLPIVALNATGICDVVQNNINGFLVSESESEFISCIDKLISEGELRKKFSEESKKIAQQNFTDAICANKMLQLYQKVISEYKKT